MHLWKVGNISGQCESSHVQCRENVGTVIKIHDIWDDFHDISFQHWEVRPEIFLWIIQWKLIKPELTVVLQKCYNSILFPTILSAPYIATRARFLKVVLYSTTPSDSSREIVMDFCWLCPVLFCVSLIFILWIYWKIYF